MIIRVVSTGESILQTVEQEHAANSFDAVWEYYSDNYVHDDSEGDIILVIDCLSRIFQVRRVQYIRALT